MTKGVNASKAKRQPLSLAEKVRTRIELHGGRATSSQILPYVGATAAEVKALPGIVVTQDRSGVGRPATIFTLAQRDIPTPSVAETSSRPGVAEQFSSTHRDANHPTVVQLDAYRPEPAQARKPAPEQRRSEPLGDSNPFLTLL
ncbi:hypothetical protein [Streptomyces sp. NBRC 110028]|uniref:hypothetical protein n=1 Tax=Streptomyces sp. NBRC 110028 TaxID=1621260 RepID=UPI000A9B4F3C|nr:hypothetical protein [Streptomyces sp. NBRC 110028]